MAYGQRLVCFKSLGGAKKVRVQTFNHLVSQRKEDGAFKGSPVT